MSWNNIVGLTRGAYVQSQYARGGRPQAPSPNFPASGLLDTGGWRYEPVWPSPDPTLLSSGSILSPFDVTPNTKSILTIPADHPTFHVSTIGLLNSDLSNEEILDRLSELVGRGRVLLGYKANPEWLTAQLEMDERKREVRFVRRDWKQREDDVFVWYGSRCYELEVDEEAGEGVDKKSSRLHSSKFKDGSSGEGGGTAQVPKSKNGDGSGSGSGSVSSRSQGQENRHSTPISSHLPSSSSRRPANPHQQSRLSRGPSTSHTCTQPTSSLPHSTTNSPTPPLRLVFQTTNPNHVFAANIMPMHLSDISLWNPSLSLPTLKSLLSAHVKAGHLRRFDINTWSWETGWLDSEMRKDGLRDRLGWGKDPRPYVMGPQPGEGRMDWLAGLRGKEYLDLKL